MNVVAMRLNAATGGSEGIRSHHADKMEFFETLGVTSTLPKE